MIRQRTPAQKLERRAARAQRAAARSVLPLELAPVAKSKRKRLSPRRATERRSERVRDREHLADVHGLDCCARDLGPCAGRIEADHMGRRGYGQKSSDATAAPMCTRHHRMRTDFTGDFKGWDQARMRVFLAGAIERTQRAIARRRAA